MLQGQARTTASFQQIYCASAFSGYSLLLLDMHVSEASLAATFGYGKDYGKRVEQQYSSFILPG